MLTIELCLCNECTFLQRNCNFKSNFFLSYYLSELPFYFQISVTSVVNVLFFKNNLVEVSLSLIITTYTIIPILFSAIYHLDQLPDYPTRRLKRKWLRDFLSSEGNS